MATPEQGAQAAGRPRLRSSTTVFLVGNIEPTMEWYKRLGFESEYYPPGFAILKRDEIQIFLQQQPGYVMPDDPGRIEREAWNVYFITENVKMLYEEYAALPELKISRVLCRQEYGMMEFDVMDLNGHRLVFAEPLPAKQMGTEALHLQHMLTYAVNREVTLATHLTSDNQLLGIQPRMCFSTVNPEA